MKALHTEREELTETLSWWANFDIGEATARLGEMQQERDSLERELERLATEVAAAKKMLPEFEGKAALGFRISYWFSVERVAAIEKLRSHRRLLEDLERERPRVRRRLRERKGKIEPIEAEIRRYEAVNGEAAKNRIAEIDAELSVRELQRDDLALRKRELDIQLKEPRKERKRLRDELDSLEEQIEACRARLEGAQSIDRRMSLATDARGRAILHRECEEWYGDGSPRRVIHEAQREERDARRRLSTVQRSLAKLDTRIAAVVRRASREVQALVIDGNNLSYEGREFIGLAAVRALTNELSGRYEVTVVFDASIRSALRANDRDLEGMLPAVKVHVVAARSSADETILSAAHDPYTYVISNDRFVDYPDKAPVREHRVIRHEIINGRVLVHDLFVDVPFVRRG